MVVLLCIMLVGVLRIPPSWGVRMASPAWCRSVPPQLHRMCPTHSHIHPPTHTHHTHHSPYTLSLSPHPPPLHPHVMLHVPSLHVMSRHVTSLPRMFLHPTCLCVSHTRSPARPTSLGTQSKCDEVVCGPPISPSRVCSLQHVCLCGDVCVASVCVSIPPTCSPYAVQTWVACLSLSSECTPQESQLTMVTPVRSVGGLDGSSCLVSSSLSSVLREESPLCYTRTCVWYTHIAACVWECVWFGSAVLSGLP